MTIKHPKKDTTGQGSKRNSSKKDTKKPRANKRKTDKRDPCQGKISGGETCAYKASLDYDNRFCKKHGKQFQKEEDEKNGIVRCKSRLNCNPKKPNIKAILPPGYTKKSCVSCLARAATNDKARRTNIKTINKNLKKTKSDKRRCRKCPKETNLHSISKMGKTKKGDITDLCQLHFDERSVIEKKRNRKGRDYSTYEAKPARKQSKKEFRKNHPELMFKYYTNYRIRQLKENPEKYRARCAVNAKRFREKHPNKIKEMKKKRFYDIDVACSYYCYQANKRGYDFDLNREQFEEFVTGSCFYCCSKYDKKLLGIDRVNNNMSYTEKNSVPCCQICNFMKNTLNKETFILMCTHIVAYNKLYSDAILYPDIFNNFNSTNHAGYKCRAKQRGIEFTLSVAEYNEIQKRKRCYICGKKNDENHTNGIDRKNNDIGYLYHNCELCCGNCNFLKGELTYDDFLDQCRLVFLFNWDHLDVLHTNWISSKFMEKNIHKPTKAENLISSKIKKQIRHEKTLETMEKRVAEINQDNNKLPNTKPLKKTSKSDSEEISQKSSKKKSNEPWDLENMDYDDEDEISNSKKKSSNTTKSSKKKSNKSTRNGIDSTSSTTAKSSKKNTIESTIFDDDSETSGDDDSETFNDDSEASDDDSDSDDDNDSEVSNSISTKSSKKKINKKPIKSNKTIESKKSISKESK